MTSSFHESVQLRLAWRLLWAKPSMWIASAIVSLILAATPLLIGLAGPFGRGWSAGVLRALALGPVGLVAQLVAVHLSGQAYRASAQAVASESGRGMRRRLSIGGLARRGRNGQLESQGHVDFPPPARKPTRRR